jgi:hypothetical protein
MKRDASGDTPDRGRPDAERIAIGRKLGVKLLDCVAAWRGIQALCLDLAATPEQLVPLVERSVRDFNRIYDHFDALLKAAGQPSVTWLGIPSFGKLHIPSCDFASMISTKHFVEFSLPCLRREMKGMTHDFFPNKDRFHIATENGPLNKPTEVMLKDLKAVFVVRTFDGDLTILSGRLSRRRYSLRNAA